MFRTTFNITECPFKIDYYSKIIFIGSCFTENIGNYLKELRFDIVQNPFGIVYDPLSLAKNVEFLSNKRLFEESDLNYYNEHWFSFYHHGRYSDTDKNICLGKINASINEASEFIRNADFLFLTLGTAFIYKHKKTEQIVANCHKLPSETFVKSLLNVEDIINEYLSVITNLRKINPKIKIIFTVSPVRHWNEKAVNNQLSKSVLFVAVHEIIKKISNCFYFPAYELVMDDLRDYRFYSEDMLHLNETAIFYIFENFLKTFITEDTRKIINEVQFLLKAKRHRPFSPDSIEYKCFKSTYFKQILKMEKQYPFLDLSEFKKFFNEK